MQKKVLISVPNTGWIHKHVAFALLKLQQDKRHDVTIILPTHNPLENNQHHIVNDFLAGDYDFWISFDSDNPPKANVLDLVDLNRDIIGCPTPVWHTGKLGERPYYWNVYDKEGDAYAEHKEMEGLQKVDATGMGCFIISRRVFLNKEMQKGAFTRKLNPDGTVLKGNDISFCERATEQGFEIFAHYDYPCMHFNEVEATEIINHFNSIQ